MGEFFSKVLLFGEHTVVGGGQALAIPFSHFSGSWNYTNNDIHRGLAGFADYIDHHDTLFKIIDVDRFFSDLDRGLIFQSNIPIGFGLGSSGALVAAVYKRYASPSKSESNTGDLQQVLASLESHFHGKSSGFDPLVSYLNQPILLRGGQIHSLKFTLPKKKAQLFLINTNKPRSTGPLVEQFQDYMAVGDNKRTINSAYLPIVKRAIRALINENELDLYQAMEDISGYQYAYLDFLIDDGSKALWKEGLASDYFKIKICGAGGGGFLLGITKDIDLLRSTYSNREIIPLL